MALPKETTARALIMIEGRIFSSLLEYEFDIDLYFV